MLVPQSTVFWRDWLTTRERLRLVIRVPGPERVAERQFLPAVRRPQPAEAGAAAGILAAETPAISRTARGS